MVEETTGRGGEKLAKHWLGGCASGRDQYDHMSFGTGREHCFYAVGQAGFSVADNEEIIDR